MKSVMILRTAYATQNTSVSVHFGFLIDLSQIAATGMHWKIVAKVDPTLQAITTAMQAQHTIWNLFPTKMRM